MISLFDDYFHVSKACSLLENFPGDRFLIRFLTCAAGESLWATRLLSFVFILLTIFFFIKIFKLSQKNIFYYGIFLNPILFFPFFYASQFATAFSVFWSTLCLFFLEKKQNGAKWIFLSFFLGALGPLGRFESLYIFFMLFISFVIYDSLKEQALEPFVKKSFAFISSRSTNVIALVLGFKLAEWGMNHLQGSFNELKFLAYLPNVYPKNYYYGSQVWAIVLYLKNYFLPFSHTFFGDWSQWYKIGQHYRILFISYFSILIVLMSFFFMSLKKPIKYIASGMILFILISTGFSLFIRSQWYYPSRQYLASFILTLFILKFINLKLKQKMVQLFFVIAILINVTSFVYAFTFQYSSRENFYEHEKFFSQNVDPFLILGKADLYFKEGKYKTSLAGYRKAYELVPAKIATISNSAAIYHFLALEGAYRSYEMMGLREESFKILHLLRQGTYYIGTHVCLQDDRMKADECLEGDRKTHFCRYYLGQNISKLIQVRPYSKKSMNSFCKSIKL